MMILTIIRMVNNYIGKLVENLFLPALILLPTDKNTLLIIKLNNKI